MSRIFFATDLHGSDKCLLKFLNAPKFYGATVLIMGGDITGKRLIPVIKNEKGHYEAIVMGTRRKAKNEADLREILQSIRFMGCYPYITDAAGLQSLDSDKEKTEEILKDLMLKEVKNWIEKAEVRLKGSGVQMFITGGNDDVPEIEEIISSSNYVVYPEGKVVNVGDGYEMISSGWSNQTPWKTPRECTEEELLVKIESMASEVSNISKSIFNLHVPPKGSGLDSCAKLDENFKPVVAGGEVVMIGAGSGSVRKAIESYQPLLGLHGHIHESKGYAKLGRTLCLNPGSEYGEGILCGALVDVVDDKVTSYQLTVG